MADDSLLVTISGAALSLLFYENVRSLGDQMGFLLGETLEFVVKKFTDSDNQVETVKTHMNVETVVTWPTPDILHDSTGRINKQKLKDFIRDKSKQIIGWFRFRRNMGLVPTLRDKVLHKQFASHFSSINGSQEDLFVMCLLSSSTSNTRGTHKFRHVFLRHKRGSFEPIPLRINNLGDDASRHDGSDYKPTPVKKSLDEPDIFTKLIDALNLDLSKTFGVESVTTIQKAAEQYLNTLIPKVCESDREVAELEKQVQELKAKIFAHNIMKKLEINGNSDIGDTNYETEKNSDSEESRLSEKNDHSPPRIETPGKICDESLLLKDYVASTGHAITSHKTRNTAASIAKSVNQEKSRRMGLGIDVQTSLNEDPFTNIVSEMKMDISESAANRNRRPIATISEITKQPTCKAEQNEIGVSKGRGPGIHEFTPGMKKARRTSSSITIRCNSEKNSVPQLSDQEFPELNSLQNSTPLPVQISHAQAVRKNLDNTRSISDTSDSH